MEFYQTYSDWFYIGGVFVAFLFFIFWNKKRNTSIKNRKRRNFKQSIKEKRLEKET